MDGEERVEGQPQDPPVEPQDVTMDVSVPVATNEQQLPQDVQQVSPPDTVGSSSGTGSLVIAAPPGLVVPASAGPVDHLATVAAFLREDPVLRVRLIEQLVEQNETTAAARTQGENFGELGGRFRFFFLSVEWMRVNLYHCFPSS